MIGYMCSECEGPDLVDGLTQENKNLRKELAVRTQQRDEEARWHEQEVDIVEGLEGAIAEIHSALGIAADECPVAAIKRLRAEAATAHKAGARWVADWLWRRKNDPWRSGHARSALENASRASKDAYEEAHEGEVS